MTIISFYCLECSDPIVYKKCSNCKTCFDAAALRELENRVILYGKDNAWVDWEMNKLAVKVVERDDTIQPLQNVKQGTFEY